MPSGLSSAPSSSAPLSSAGLLLVGRSAQLRAEVARLAALAGVPVDVVTDPALVRGGWGVTDLVVVEADLAPAIAALGLRRRAGVVVAAQHPDETAAWRAAVSIGAESVVTLPADERRLLDRLLRPAASGTAPVLAVLPAGGGVGASVVAAALALAAAQQQGAATLLDADPAAGGVDLLLGLERRPGLRLDDLGAPDGVLSAAALRESAPLVRGVTVLSAGRSDPRPLPARLLLALVEAARTLDAPAVVDLPARLGPEVEAALGIADRVVLVTVAAVRPCAAAASVARFVGARCARVDLVVRRGAGDPLRVHQVAAAVGLPVSAVVPTQARVRRAVEHGALPAVVRRGALAAACRRILDGAIDD